VNWGLGEVGGEGGAQKGGGGEASVRMDGISNL